MHDLSNLTSIRILCHHDTIMIISVCTEGPRPHVPNGASNVLVKYYVCTGTERGKIFAEWSDIFETAFSKLL